MDYTPRQLWKLIQLGLRDEVVNSQTWLEKQKFAFEISKKTDGTYYVVNFESESSNIAKIKAGLRLNEKVLRFLVIQQDASQPLEALKS